MYFKLKPKCGNHSEKDSKGKLVVYKAGDGAVIQSDSDLSERFPGKFEKITEVEIKPTFKSPLDDIEIPGEVKEKVTSLVKKVLKKKSDTAKDFLASLGTEVTKEFPLAVKEDLRVFANGEAYSVIEADEADKVLNKAPLKKASVKAFIEKYLK